QESQSFELITKLSPNYVSLSARHLEQVRDNALFEKLRDLKALVASTGGKTILQQIDQKKSESLARNTSFDLVQGSYYERPSASVFSPELAEAAVALY
ncbi:MAG TPA: hypothetical protein VIE65_07990, partial [Methylobacter sp.]